MVKLCALVEYVFQAQTKLTRTALLGLQHFRNVALQMAQALLLLDGIELLGIIAFAAIGSHDSGVVGRYHLPHLLVTVARTDLIYRAFQADKYHQMSGAPTDAPSGVVGIDYRRFTHAATQLPIAGTHLRFPAPQRVLRYGALSDGDSGEFLQYHRQFAHRHAGAVMQCVCRRFDSHTHPVCRGPKLVPCQARRGASHALATHWLQRQTGTR